MRMVKDWLIKKLGGYTQTDYDKWWSYQNGTAEFWQRRAENLQNRVVTLNVEETVGKKELMKWTFSQERAFVMERLTSRLARQLIDNVWYERTEMPLLDQTQYRVRLMVMRPADRTEEDNNG